MNVKPMVSTLLLAPENFEAILAVTSYNRGDLERMWKRAERKNQLRAICYIPEEKMRQIKAAMPVALEANPGMTETRFLAELDQAVEEVARERSAQLTELGRQNVG